MPEPTKPILQKVYLYLSPEGEIGITKKNKDLKSKEYIVSHCQALKKQTATTIEVVKKILENCLFTLEAYLYVDDMSYTQIIEAIEKEEKLDIGENIHVYQEEGGNLEGRISEIRNYLTMNSSVCLWKDENLKQTILSDLKRVPQRASAISFLLSVEDAIAPSYEDLAKVQARFQKYNEFPFKDETYLADVTALFDR